MTQRTIAREGRLAGVGVHTGAAATVLFKPAVAGSGIRFFRDGRCVDKQAADAVEGQRCSAVGAGADRILTVEHLLAAATGLGITELEIHVNGPEIPVLDGSALPFVSLFKELGLCDLGQDARSFRVREPIFCHAGMRAIMVVPDERSSIVYTLDYDLPGLRNQRVEYCRNENDFESQIAPARTFCSEAEAQALREKGFGLGADTDNTLVMTAAGPLRNRLRFPDECARHKVLDIMGDLALLDFFVIGRIIGLRSGHDLNRQLALEIKKQKKDIENG